MNERWSEKNQVSISINRKYQQGNNITGTIQVDPRIMFTIDNSLNITGCVDGLK